MHLGTINISNKATSAEIDIEGVIGIPENWQFDEPGERVATYDKFKAAVSDIKSLKASDITVNIRSIGGNVNDALLIFDTLCELPATITTKCYGYTASAATIIAQAASPGKRVISDNSLYLIHQGSPIALGNANDIQEALDLLEKTDDRIANIYSSRSGKDISHFVSLMGENNGNGKWLSPDEAIEAGLADAKIKGKEVVNMPSDAMRVLNLPSIPENNNTKENKNMKVKNTWKAVLDFFGFDTEKENELTEAQVEKINNELSDRQRTIEALTKELEERKSAHEKVCTEKDSAITDKETEIANLRAKVSDLESQLAQAKAEPTKTEDKEDPDPVNPKMDPRTEAYAKDLKCFKEQMQ